MLWTTFHILSLIILLGVSFPGLVRYPYHDIVCWAASTTGTTSFSTRVSSHRKESHTAQVASISSSLPSILPSGGLVNLGNTCYLNAQLQCAYHIPYIRELILNATSSSSSHYRPTSSPSHALKSLGHVFNSMKTASIQGQGQIGQISSVSTATLCKTLGINVFEQQGIHCFIFDVVRLYMRKSQLILWFNPSKKTRRNFGSCFYLNCNFHHWRICTKAHTKYVLDEWSISFLLSKACHTF